MRYQKLATLDVQIDDAIAWISFSDAPTEHSSELALEELTTVVQQLELDVTISVVVFQSRHPDIFNAQIGGSSCQQLDGKFNVRNEYAYQDFKALLTRIGQLPQVTIARVEGIARYGGHELAMACDSCIAARGKARFMPMETAMAGLQQSDARDSLASIYFGAFGRDYGVGQVALGNRDYGADQAEYLGMVQRALDPHEMGPYVEETATRMAQSHSAKVASMLSHVIAPAGAAAVSLA